MTFGFEIEGNFTDSLVNNLADNWIKKNDASVDIKEKETAKLGLNISDYSEINSPVFDNYKRMLEVLAAFKLDKNWIANDSCGIHIHVGFKKDRLAKIKLSDFNVIGNLQDYAKKNLCSHIKKRINTNHFCKPYNIKDFNYSYQDFDRREKYSFMGNHPSGTFEFRFFSACEHKDLNAKKFINYLYKRLKNYKYHRGVRYFLLNKNNNFKIEHKIESNDKLLEGGYLVGKTTEKILKLDYNLLSKTENAKERLYDDIVFNPAFDEGLSLKYGIDYTIYGLKDFFKRSKKVKSLTLQSKCRGYHNDCECRRCLAIIENGDNNCGEQHCDECENYCNDLHCDTCQGDDSGNFCERRGCDYCMENNEQSYNEMFDT